MYEEAVSVPLIIYDPSRFLKPRTTDSTIPLSRNLSADRDKVDSKTCL